MALAATYFYADVAQFVTVAIQIVFVIIEIVALVNCITQRADAFPVVGSLSKNGWLAILTGSVLVTLVCGVFTSSLLISFFAFIAITATGVYMLDVRPALREATDGSGNW